MVILMTERCRGASRCVATARWPSPAPAFDASQGTRMSKLPIMLGGLGAALLASVACAQVTLYEQEGLRGRTFTANGPIHNLDKLGFNDRASSIIVDRGDWQVCEHADFKGRCM